METVEVIYRQDALEALRTCYETERIDYTNGNEYINYEQAVHEVEQLPSAQPDENKYEYHYDHTDCIWYRPEARNRCPVTCAQYRDGWNDAMNYIFRDGKGYMPYRRDKQYGE